jgi:cytochrome c oxidase subunit 3
MYITLIFLGIIMATVIGWLLKQTINVQPWVANTTDDEFSGASLDTNTKTIALATFLAVATSLFGLFISAYTERSEFYDWRPLNEPGILWVNTAFLVIASIAYQFTRNAALAGRTGSLKPALIVAGAMTILFLGGQLLAWQQLNASGVYVENNPANAFFFLLTAVHGIHLLGGLWVWARSAVKLMTGADADSVRISIELCTIYWHYLLLVWVVLFGMLLST